MSKACDECKFCLLEDQGYSNWTVDGTLVYCLKGRHPELGFDRWYGESGHLKFAEQCAEFEAGAPVQLDVEREEMPYSYDDIDSGKLSEFYTDDPEIKPLLDAWEIKIAAARGW